MTNKINRRKFLIGGTALGVASGISNISNAQAPSIKKGSVKPVVVASGNGHTMKNGGKFNCVETAYNRIVKGDDVLDALIEGVNIVELDPQDASVGQHWHPEDQVRLYSHLLLGHREHRPL